MEGRKYNRAVRLHKVMYEVFMGLAWKGFIPWKEINHSEDLVYLEETLEVIRDLIENVSHFPGCLP